MEVAGLAVGAAGLAGTFTACVDCFDYVRVAKRTGKDWQTSILKLDLIWLRFTRWGEAAGIIQDDERIAWEMVKAAIVKPGRSVDTVKATLIEILELFKESEETCRKVADGLLKSQTLETDTEDFEKAPMKKLHEAMRNLSIGRKCRPSLSQKVKWALYRQGELTHLLENLNDLVSKLVETISAQQQTELCSKELATMNTDEDLAILNEVFSQPIVEDALEPEIDGILHERVTEEIKQRKTMTTATWKRSKAGDGSRIQQGDAISGSYGGALPDKQAEYIVEDSELGKGVVFHQGDTYG